MNSPLLVEASSGGFLLPAPGGVLINYRGQPPAEMATHLTQAGKLTSKMLRRTCCVKGPTSFGGHFSDCS